MNGFAIVCSGQGTQPPDLFDRFTSEAARRRIEAIFPDGLEEAALQRGEVAQQALALYAELLWKELSLPRPNLVMGYSLGELIACGVSGFLPWESVIPLARERGRLMASAFPEPTGLVSVRGLCAATASELTAPYGGAVAIDNGNHRLIVGLRERDRDAFLSAVREKGGTPGRWLAVEVASHTPFLAAASQPFAECLKALPWLNTPAYPILSATSLSLVRSAAEMQTLLVRQLTEPVRWGEAMEAARERGIRVFLEIGPGQALATLLRETYPDVEARSVGEFQTLAGAARWVARSLARR